jgi:hypothetical protein
VRAKGIHICPDCGDRYKGQTDRCWSCTRHYYQWLVRGYTAVAKAIRRRVLAPAHRHLCVDCGAKAYCYDHRDYRKPLEVEPVCRSCNKRRGPALYQKRFSAIA